MSISTMFNFISILEDLIDSSAKNTDCIRFIKMDTFRSDPNYINVKDLVIKQAFMDTYTTWERFLESSFIFYALGVHSLSGKSPHCYITPRDYEHTYNLIKGPAQFPNWTKNDEVMKLAENLFENGEPYKSILSPRHSSLLEMKKIRDHISHNSKKSKEVFDTLVRNKLSPAEVGISVSDYLILSKNRTDPPFYKEYFDLLVNTANNIAQY